MKTSIRELRMQTKSVIQAVERGEVVILTYRGKECAKIVPIRKKSTTAVEHPIFGMWRDHDQTSDVQQYLDKLRDVRDAS